MKKVVWMSVAGALILVVILGGLFFYYRGQGNGTPTTSMTVNGTKYWALNVTLTNNLPAIQFSSVTFIFSYPCNHATPPPPGGGLGQGCSHVTFTTVTCPNGSVSQLCQSNLPQIQVVFHDGTTEYFNNATIIQGVITYDSQKEANRLYFTIHSDPRVGIEWVTDHAPPDTLLLLVSA
jgi:hypothetical protein